MLQHPQWYDAERVDSRHPLRNEPHILLPQYEEACCEVSWSGQAVGVTAVLALSAVIGYPIHTFWPPLSGSLTRHHCHGSIQGVELQVPHAQCTLYGQLYRIRPKTWRGPH